MVRRPERRSPRRRRFSPRERGWSPTALERDRRADVLPARAGVVLGRSGGRLHRTGSPRASGVVPAPTTNPDQRRAFSPRARGSGHDVGETALGRVLPSSGGGPKDAFTPPVTDWFSSREREWSQFVRLIGYDWGVLPARAGVVPGCGRRRRTPQRSPRASGGSPTPPPGAPAPRVLPARAWVLGLGKSWCAAALSSPHCGGGSDTCARGACFDLSSRASRVVCKRRGCSRLARPYFRQYGRPVTTRTTLHIRQAVSAA